MIKESFCLFAIEILSENSVGKRKLHANKPYYLRKGYSLSGRELYIDCSLTTPTNLYDVYSGDVGIQHPHITLSAIVGENGAGKSTLVEFLIRLLNNLGANTFGEKEVFPGAEHIHHIDNVNGALYYVLDDIPYCLELRNRKVALFSYEYSSEADRVVTYKKCAKKFEWKQSKDYKPTHSRQVLHMQRLYNHLFYTIVSNYSIYAYNTSDFSAESNSIEYEHQCRYPYLTQEEREKKAISDDECNWLRGVFHKNDGYQMPVVLTPYRKKGCIDINDENTLAVERLTSLVLFTQFNTINEHLCVKEMRFAKPDEDDADWLLRCYERVTNNCGLADLPFDDFLVLANQIIVQWGRRIKMNIHKDRALYSNVAREYLVYKTLKVIHKYSSHWVCYKQLCDKVEYRKTHIKDKATEHYYMPWAYDTVKRLCLDPTHVTRKLRLTLAYFKFHLYDGTPWEVKELGQRIGEVYFFAKDVNINASKLRVFTGLDDLYPPPFVGTRFVLQEKGTGEEVAFETLSSGEKQIAYATSSVVYHLNNINSVGNEKDVHRIHYGYVNVILEEIELYFHPEMQKSFVRYLLNAIRQVDLKNIKGVNIILVTHSPFVLSDIPSSSILTLRRENHEGKPYAIETFGTNIHTLLKNGFFMQEGTIGNYAQWMCDYILVVLQLWRYFNTHPDIGYIDMMDEPLEDQITEPLVNERVYDSLVNYVHDDCVWICEDKFKEKHTAQWIKTCIDTFENRLIREALYNQYLSVFPEWNAHLSEVEELKHRLEQLTGGHVYVETK